MAKHPWSRQTGEPSVWYDRFHQLYLLVPATERSVSRAWRSAAVDRENKRVSGAWEKRARDHRWADRAAAYDDHMRRRIQAAYEKERMDDRRRRIDVGRAVRTRLVQALKELDPTTAGWGQVVNGVVAINAELRKEYNDDPEARTDQATPAGRTTAADLDDLTDEELEAIEAAARIMAGRTHGD